MTNPFDDLETAETESDAAEMESDDTAEEMSTDGDADTSPADDADTSPTATAIRESRERPIEEEQTSDEVNAAESGPAFEYGEVRQKPLYARDETWTEFEKNLRTTIAPTLAEADVVDEETREIHDAVLRLANAEPERVAELVLEARREP
ncbi:hypothetical protein [Halosolutus gelatinilyticus]|uniref:hypothetical protein n=1 Tax=Halosolutus gelatinilyticus TaxID=2931975 RepID=UPI001FF2B7E6|nr:hypothetical protein [Halosolutus gelatinilyticus]